MSVKRIPTKLSLASGVWHDWTICTKSLSQTRRVGPAFVPKVLRHCLHILACCEDTPSEVSRYPSLLRITLPLRRTATSVTSTPQHSSWCKSGAGKDSGKFCRSRRINAWNCISKQYRQSPSYSLQAKNSPRSPVPFTSFD